MVDALQALTKSDSQIKDPITLGRPGAVLQYANDTLILIKGMTLAALNLRYTLDQFSSATGLHINFSKSVMVPMHLDD